MIRAAKAKMAAAKKEAARLAKNPNLHRVPGEEEDEFTEKKDDTFGLGNFDNTGLEHDDYRDENIKKVADLTPEERAAMTKDELRQMEQAEKDAEVRRKQRMLQEKRDKRDAARKGKKDALKKVDSDGNIIAEDSSAHAAAPIVMVCVVILIIIAAVVVVFATGIVVF